MAGADSKTSHLNINRYITRENTEQLWTDVNYLREFAPNKQYK